VSAADPTTPATAEERAIEAALRRIALDEGPLGGHPAYRSAWRRQAARENVDTLPERP